MTAKEGRMPSLICVLPSFLRPSAEGRKEEVIYIGGSKGAKVAEESEPELLEPTAGVRAVASGNILQGLQTRAISLVRVDAEDAEVNADRFVAILASGLERLLKGKEGPEEQAALTVDFSTKLPVTTDDKSNGYAEER
jgi:hypothetical protein